MYDSIRMKDVTSLVRSMTGFGRGVTTTKAFQLTVEMRSVNHRFLEVHSRFPKEWMEAEVLTKKTISTKLARGKVDVTVNVKELEQAAQTIAVNTALIEAYAAARQDVAKLAPLAEQWQMSELFSLEGALVQQKDLPTQQVNEAVHQALLEAMDALLAMRETEGAMLKQVLVEQQQALAEEVATITALAPQAVEKYRTRLLERLQSVAGQIDVEERTIAEVAIYAERVDIAEELDRLQSHFVQFAKTLESEQAIGRKLDFIMQEMHREINTIGSKNQSTVVSVAVVQAKTILEKMREQVQNIE